MWERSIILIKMAKKKGKLHKYHVKRRKLNTVKIFILIACLAVVVYFIICGVKIMNLSAERDKVQEKNQELREEVENLNQELENIDSDQFYERLARKNLKLVRSNELLFILPTIRTADEDQATATDETTATDKTNDHSEQNNQ